MKQRSAPLRLDAVPLPHDVLDAVAEGVRLGRRYRYWLGEAELRVTQEHAAILLALCDGDVARAEAFVAQAVGRALWLVGALERE